MEKIKEVNEGIELIKKSDLSGKEHTMFLPISKKDFLSKEHQRKNEPNLIQDVYPEFSSAQREFIKSGITPEEWDNVLS